jgi:hypothetical protein
MLADQLRVAIPAAPLAAIDGITDTLIERVTP